MLNRVILIGRLVADPELRVTGGGIPIATFRIAVDRNFKNAQGEVETDFINIVVWRKQAELLSKWLSKGPPGCVDGRLQVRTYQSQEGQNRLYHGSRRGPVQLLDRPKGQQGEPGSNRFERSPARASDRRFGSAYRRRPAFLERFKETKDGTSEIRATRPRRSRRRRSRRSRRSAERPFRRKRKPRLFPRRKVCRFTRKACCISTTRITGCCASSSPTGARSFPAGLPERALNISAC